MTTARAHTTGIGSLPHHNADAALEYSFRMGIPFLPQIPIRNPWEFMIAQALEGLPGLQADTDGSVTLNTDIWLSRAAAFTTRLAEAFSSDERLEAFEPAPSISSCWQPFVWELEERRVSLAKIQIAGPMTAQWSLKLKDSQGQPVPMQAFVEKNPELTTQIFRLVLARALAMCKRLKRAGVQPLLYLDEPGLYAYSAQNARHVLALQELKVLVQALVKQGVQVGIHCCGNTDWAAVLSLPIQYLSLDTALSLPSLLSRGEELDRFLRNGGRLSLGVIPTGRSPVLHSLDAASLSASVTGALKLRFGKDPALVRQILSEALFTPACGLALQTTADAELILDSLARVESLSRSETRPSRGEAHAERHPV
jgi:hypothetical protein